MDLSRFTAVDTLDVTIQHSAFEEGKEPIFTMAGPCHFATKKAEKAIADAYAKARGRAIDINKMSTAKVAACVLGWKNITWEGKPMEWSPENALMLLSTPGLKFIKDQIQIALGDDESFFTA